MRRTSLISPWGVGAIVPFPKDESLMIAGLDMWKFGSDKEEFVIKDARFEKWLGVRELRRPPDFRDSQTDSANATIRIPAVRFPRWQYCPFCGTMTKTTFFSAPLLCDGYSWKHGRTCTGSKFKRHLIPERFIVVCPDGHIDDFPIMEWIHHGQTYDKNTCRLKRSTGGTSASLTGVFYECSCGAKRSLAGATKDGALEQVGYKCTGAKPWLGIEEDEQHPCENPKVKVVQRGGTNVWFGDVRSSIFIPLDDDTVSRRIITVLDEYFDQINSHRVDGEIDRTFLKMVADFRKVDNERLYLAAVNRINNMKSETELSEEISEEEYRFFEYRVLNKNSGGDNLDFYSKNYSIQQFHPAIHRYFHSISVVPKLKEVRALVGFSRLQPDENISISEKKKMLRLGQGNWLPAIEVFGEGIFLEFSNDALDTWVQQPSVQKRVEKLSTHYNTMLVSRGMKPQNLNPKYVLIHTFAHLLINQLSFECGYGSSSIRERIYCDKYQDDHDMHGLLIYTASGDSEGSLGGLVRQGDPGRIEDTIKAAIENAKWCSADPICIESGGQGPDSCNLAACHNCALLPETCCENGNRLLDRGLVIGITKNPKIGFFDM